MTVFESSQLLLHDETTRVINGADYIFMLALKNFKVTLQFILSSYLVQVFFIIICFILNNL